MSSHDAGTAAAARTALVLVTAEDVWRALQIATLVEDRSEIEQEALLRLAAAVAEWPGAPDLHDQLVSTRLQGGA